MGRPPTRLGDAHHSRRSQAMRWSGSEQQEFPMTLILLDAQAGTQVMIVVAIKASAPRATSAAILSHPRFARIQGRA